MTWTTRHGRENHDLTNILVEGHHDDLLALRTASTDMASRVDSYETRKGIPHNASNAVGDAFFRQLADTLIMLPQSASG